MATYLWQNNLALARKHCIAAKEIMKRHLDERSELYVAIIANWGNVLFAEGRNEECLEFLKYVEKVHQEQKHPEKMNVAFLNLGFSRAELFKGNTDEAEKRADTALRVVREKHGERGKYMEEYSHSIRPLSCSYRANELKFSVYFAKGNVEFRKSKFESANSFYQKGFELQQERSPSGIFNAAFLYKQACIALETRKFDIARQDDNSINCTLRI
jgi:tetratricopeptide (TPR) repeat protein